MIIAYGISNRRMVKGFEDFFHRRIGSNNCTHGNCSTYLGRNFSYAVATSSQGNFLLLFDADDGTGMKSDEFKLKPEAFDSLKSVYNIKDFLIFKAQYSSEPLLRRFYPHFERTIPLGYFCDDPQSIIILKDHLRQNSVERDIDFLWIGRVAWNSSKTNWPKDLPEDYWSMGKRMEAYTKINELKEKHPEWNVVCKDSPVSYGEYLSLLARSKVCLDLPGVGYMTRRLVELLMLEKCILSCAKPITLNFNLMDNVHLMRANYDLTDLEEKMIALHKNPSMVSRLEDNVKNIQEYLTYDFAVDRVVQICKERWRIDITEKT